MAALYTGTAPVESDRKAFVMPKVQGEIRQVLADEGQRVRAGQLLARLDGDKLRLEVALNEATMNKLDRDYKRNLELQQKGLVSAVSLDNLKYELDAAKANWELARLQLSYCDIRSPIDGTVTQRLDVVKVGNTVTPVGGVIESGESSLFVVEDLDTLMLRVNVPERELAKLVVGQPAQLSFDAVPGHVFLGTISLISPSVNAKPRHSPYASRHAGRRPPAPRHVCAGRDHLRAQAQCLADSSHGPAGRRRPAQGLRDQGRQGGRAPVKLGLSNGAWIEVTEGLKDGEQVVVVGQGAGKPGTAVRVGNSSSRPAAARIPAVAAG
jgi:membrane fusion protein (multidrug efflux system)